MQGARFVKSVVVEAPARLHLGFIDLSGSLSRKFGSLGVAISGISTCLTVTPEKELAEVARRSVQHSAEFERVVRYSKLIVETLNLPSEPLIVVERHIPSHAGLGSGTQLALAVGRGISEAYGIPLTTAKIASLTKRGARSGIGIGVFDSGGFVVDLGRGPKTELPPELCRLDFPEDWACVLVKDLQHRGISGVNESDAFQKMAPMKASLAAALSHHTLMGVIPSVIERDFAQFVRSLEFIQQGIGEYFAPHQGGGAFTSQPVAKMIGKIKSLYPDLGVGQSSWGPTGFIFCPDLARAKEVYASCQNDFLPEMENADLEVSIHQPRNTGATITHID